MMSAPSTRSWLLGSLCTQPPGPSVLQAACRALPCRHQAFISQQCSWQHTPTTQVDTVIASGYDRDETGAHSPWSNLISCKTLNGTCGTMLTAAE